VRVVVHVVFAGVDMVQTSEEGRLVLFLNSGSSDPTRVFDTTPARRIVIQEFGRFSGARSPVIADFGGSTDNDILVVETTNRDISLMVNNGGSPPTFTRVAVATDVGTVRAGPIAAIARHLNEAGASRARSQRCLAVMGPTELLLLLLLLLLLAMQLFVAGASAGRMDFVVADFFEGTVTLFSNQGANTFTQTLIAPANALVGAEYLDSADIDGDGDLDIVVSTTQSRDVNRIVVFVNSGSGVAYTNATVLTSTSQLRGAVLADINGTCGGACDRASYCCAIRRVCAARCRRWLGGSPVCRVQSDLAGVLLPELEVWRCGDDVCDARRVRQPHSVVGSGH
jgi:hypothetical protein